MSILAWLVVGLIAGFLASKVINKSGSGLVVDIVLGIVGAIVGGHRHQYLQHLRRLHRRGCRAADLPRRRSPSFGLGPLPDSARS
jgi:uncharacterized membrane protein YeaQ/YmgE (transglycosylase-associated protein family)